jgi:hypothetical protein
MEREEIVVRKKLWWGNTYAAQILYLSQLSRSVPTIGPTEEREM